MKITQLIKELQELYEVNDNQDLEVVFFDEDNDEYAIQTFSYESSFGWNATRYFVDIRTVDEE